MSHIPLGRGAVALVDDVDFPWLTHLGIYCLNNSSYADTLPILADATHFRCSLDAPLHHQNHFRPQVDLKLSRLARRSRFNLSGK